LSSSIKTNKKALFQAIYESIKIFFYEYGSSRYFYQVLWQFFNSELRFRFSDRFFGFLATAAKGGEMGSDYFQDTQPSRICQRVGGRLASLGD